MTGKWKGFSSQAERKEEMTIKQKGKQIMTGK